MDIENIASEWGSAANAWDAAVSRVDRDMSAATETFLDALEVRPGERVLELAAGPGSLGASWSALVGQTGSVVLSDLAPEMVEAARGRNAALDNVTVEVLDATAIALPDASFDVVACRMGLMFALDPSIALAEAHRVAAPGGRFGAMTWGEIEHNPWITCVGMAAMIAGITKGGPPVGPGGIFSLSDADQLQALVASAGFDDVRVEAVPVAFHPDDVDSHIDQVSALAGPLAAQLRTATPEQLDVFRRTAAELAAPHASADGVVLPGQTLLVTARR